MNIDLLPERGLLPGLFTARERCTALCVDDPAIEAAPVMRELAHGNCQTDPESGETCFWYHGYSLYQSLLVQKTPRRAGRRSLGWQPSHAVFFLDAFRSLAQTGGLQRALVSASSDYMLPSLIVDAGEQAGAAVDITLVDICETPLWINHWYAARRGHDMETIRSNILDYEPAAPFDLLCTHHLLNFIAPQQRPALFRRWRDALRRGGRLVFVNSIRPAETADRRSEYTEAQTAQLARVIAEAEDRLLMRFPPHSEMLRAMTERLSRKTFFPVPSPHDIADQLTAAGFAIDGIVSLDSYDAVIPGWARRANKTGTMGLIATAV